MKILVVDDEKVVLEILTAALAKAGYEDVTCTDSAAGAFELIAEADEPYDCFLLDILMPTVDGIELCESIRNIPAYSQTPIIMITRMTDKSYIDRAFAAGATDYVTKPFDAIELGARVRLADRLSWQQRRIRDSHTEVEVLRDQLERQNDIDLSTPFALDDVMGSLEFLALQNYLLQFSNGRSRMTVFTVKIANSPEIYSKTNAVEFRLVINSVGDAIAESLKSREFFLTYAGNGVFPVVIRDRHNFSIEDLRVELEGQVADLDFFTEAGAHVTAEIVIGGPARHKLLARGRVLDTFNEAISNAEAEAHTVAPPKGFLKSVAANPASLLSRVLGVF